MAWKWAKELPWDIFQWEGNKQWRRRQSSQCDDAKDDARASRRTEAQRSRLGRWRQCARESEKKNRTIFILITSKITSCMSNAFPKSIICRARLWRPEKKFFSKAGKYFQKWVLKTHAWKVGDQEVVRFQVGVDQVHQVQLMHKFQNLKKRWCCRTRHKHYVWNTSAVRWRARGSAIVLSLFVTLIRSRRDPRGASLDTRTLPSEKVKHLEHFLQNSYFLKINLDTVM